MSDADEMKEIVKKAFDIQSGKSFVAYTKDYIYVLLPASPDLDKWLEVSYDLAEKKITKKELEPKRALAYLLEELVEGLPGYNPDLPWLKNVGEIDKILNIIQ